MTRIYHVSFHIKAKYYIILRYIAKQKNVTLDELLQQIIHYYIEAKGYLKVMDTLHRFHETMEYLKGKGYVRDMDEFINMDTNR